MLKDCYRGEGKLLTDSSQVRFQARQTLAGIFVGFVGGQPFQHVKARQFAGGHGQCLSPRQKDLPLLRGQPESEDLDRASAT